MAKLCYTNSSIVWRRSGKIYGNVYNNMEREFFEKLYKASKAAFEKLFVINEKFYYCTLTITGDGLTPVISAWSYEALERESGDDEDVKYDIEWSYADSPYYAWEYESFHEVEELLQNCPSMSDMSEEEWEKELDIRIDIMEKVMRKLDEVGENNQAIYFVDEIDRSLHTKLSQYLLEEFLQGCRETYSQIIFTAHDVNLINLDNLGQDEIWFVEKDNKGESRFKLFSDFNIEKGQDALKAYLCGRFGALLTIRRGK